MFTNVENTNDNFRFSAVTSVVVVKQKRKIILYLVPFSVPSIHILGVSDITRGS